MAFKALFLAHAPDADPANGISQAALKQAGFF